jgi:hypothetical protein
MFLTAGSFQGLIGPSLIGPDRRSGSTKSKTWNATYEEVLIWAVTEKGSGGVSARLRSRLPLELAQQLHWWWIRPWRRPWRRPRGRPAVPWPLRLLRNQAFRPRFVRGLG